MGPETSEPAYRTLGIDELRRRAERAVAMLADCRTCPRGCGVDRLRDRWSVCKTGRHAVVASYGPHFGEEDCLRGSNGSGTIFFGHCNLRCVFCQNYDISQGFEAGPATPGSSAAEIAAMMLDLEGRGCHNINFVTPEHVVPQLLEALVVAVERGLRLPVVYNTSAYDSLESLELLDGVVDIYMPDLKLWTRGASKKYLMTKDYPDAARAAVAAMHEQVGPLVLDEAGLARRGLLIRHLVMPGRLDETRAILRWIVDELGSDTYVNLMDQYHPAGKVRRGRFAEIGRTLRPAELDRARAFAQELGLRRLDMKAS